MPIQKIGKPGGSKIASSAEIAVLTFKTGSLNSEQFHPIADIDFGTPYFRMKDSNADWVMIVKYMLKQRANIAQSTENSVNFMLGHGSSLNNLVDDSASNLEDSCADPEKIVKLDDSFGLMHSVNYSDPRINFKCDDGGGTGRTVCEIGAEVEMTIHFLNGFDSIQTINKDTGSNSPFSHVFM